MDHQTALPLHVPFVLGLPTGTLMVPLIQCTLGGAWWCPRRARYLPVYAPRMLTDGAAGSRWSLSQHLRYMGHGVAAWAHRVAASIT